VVEERRPVDRLRQQLRRSVQCAEREPRDYVRRLVRVRGCDRQHAEHARRDVGLFLGQPAETGDPLCGIVGGLGVELGRSECGALAQGVTHSDVNFQSAARRAAARQRRVRR
jgi:hypothetical protein